jgi:hypothetical protein
MARWPAMPMVMPTACAKLVVIINTTLLFHLEVRIFALTVIGGRFLLVHLFLGLIAQVGFTITTNSVD